MPLVPGTLKGLTKFAGSNERHVPIDRNNWAPRLGFAYQLTPNTVVRAGAGVYYGMSVATNFQYAGTAFRKDGNIYFSKDGTQWTTEPDGGVTLVRVTAPANSVEITFLRAVGGPATFTVPAHSVAASNPVTLTE